MGERVCRRMGKTQPDVKSMDTRTFRETIIDEWILLCTYMNAIGIYSEGCYGRKLGHFGAYDASSTPLLAYVYCQSVSNSSCGRDLAGAYLTSAKRVQCFLGGSACS